MPGDLKRGNGIADRTGNNGCFRNVREEKACKEKGFSAKFLEAFWAKLCRGPEKTDKKSVKEEFVIGAQKRYFEKPSLFCISNNNCRPGQTQLNGFSV